MKELFEVAAGSIAGRNHRRIGLNNQDAYYGFSSSEATLAVVCDGCGSGAHSEVGAKIGARLVVEAIRRSLSHQSEESPPDSAFLEEVRQEVLVRLQSLAIAMGGDGYSVSKKIIHNYFLFTIIGALLTPRGAIVFSKGDGAIVVNGKPLFLGPFPGNAPPYLAYELLSPSPNRWQFQVHHQLAIDEVDSILIGTDGIIDLMAISEQNFPGKPDRIGAIEQFWEQDRFFKNPDLVRRQLYAIAREVPKMDWKNRQVHKEVGFLPDDTTLMVIRRRQQNYKTRSINMGASPDNKQ